MTPAIVRGMAIVWIVLSLLGVAIFVVGLLAKIGRLPGNKYIGLRVPEVRGSKEVWDGAHRVTGPLWMASGFSLLFSSLVFFTRTGPLVISAVALMFLALATLGLGASLGARTAVVLAKEEKKKKDAESSCCSSTGQEKSQAAIDEVCGDSGGDCGTCSTGGCEGPARGSHLDLQALREAVRKTDGDAP